MAAPATNPRANIPKSGHGRDVGYSGKVANCLKDASFHLEDASFHFFGQDLKSITTKPAWCLSAR